MILVVGGLASGKRAYALSLGYAETELTTGVSDNLPVLENAQDLVRDPVVDVTSLADEIASSKQVVLCREVGSGIVPLDAGDRAWRERVGALSKALAMRAAIVVRMTAGIPQPLKGVLPENRTLQVVIMRHGTTPFNEQRRYTGTTDVGLSEEGERQALASGVCPHITEVYVSPLKRARRTAELCFPNARHIVVDDVREMDFGVFEGRSAQEMENDEEYRAWVDSYCEDQCPGGERRIEFQERIARAIEWIVRDARARGLARAIVVAHGGTIMSAMNEFSDADRSYYEWLTGNCGGYRAEARFEDGALRFVDEVCFDTLSFLGAGLDFGGAAQQLADVALSSADESENRQRSGSGHPQAGPSFFANRACKHFPCHEGVDERDFNCLFCYCPLYALGPDCGGNFTYTKKGRKNCKACALPHIRESGTQMVAARFEALAELAKARDEAMPMSAKKAPFTLGER